jgi:hypothetical protein
MLCTAIASVTFMLVAYGWRVIDAGDRAAREAAVEALERRLRESRDKLSRLPQLREAARMQPASAGTAMRSSGGDWQAVAALASRTGVTLRALAPASAVAARAGSGAAAARAWHVEGRAEFSGLYAFLTGLSTLPMLVVPDSVDIKQDKGALVLGATLEVFDMPAVQVASAADALEEAGHVLTNPFGEGPAEALASASVGRLAGIVRDGRRALALFEPASGQQAVALAQGQTLGAERLIGIDAAGVTLASRAGTRRVSFEEDAR